MADPVTDAVLVNPLGKLVRVPQANATAAIQKYGYRPATDQEIAHRDLEKQYGEGFGNELAAGVEGALSGPTFGLSRHVENILGITTPEAQAARKEFNPAASTVGEILGIGASMFAVPGGGLPGVLGRGSARAGEALAASAIENTVARQIAARTVGGALEGMAYGGGQSVSEAALGDPTLTAQKVFNNVTMGGIFGGGIGAVSSALGIGAKKLLSKPIQEVSEAAPRGTGAITDVDQQFAKEFKAEGVTPEEVAKVRANPDEFFNTPTINPNPDFVAPNGAKPQKATQVFLEDLGKLDQTLEQRELAAQDAIVSSGIRVPKKDVVGVLQKQIDEIAPEGALVPAEEDAVNLIQKHIDLLAKKPGEEMSGEELRTYLQRIRKGIKKYQSQRMPGSPQSFEETQLESATHNINEMLRDRVGKAGNEGFADLMDQYSKEMNLKKTLVKQLRLDSEGNIMLGSDAFRNRVITPLQKMVAGTGSGLDTKWSKMMMDLSEVTGTDWKKIAENNMIFAKMYPELASEAQKGPWATQVLGLGQKIAEGIRHPGKATLNIAADIFEKAIPGSELRKQMARDAILQGRAGSFGVVDSILSKVKGGVESGSKLFDHNTPFGSMLVPAGVKLQQYVASHDTLESADRQLETLLALEKAQKRTDKAIDSAISGIFSGATGKNGFEYADFMKGTPQEKADELEKLAQDTNQFINDPQLMMQKLSEAIQGISDHAPDVATSINMTAVRGLNLLQQKLGSIMPKDPKMALDAKFVPNKAQLVSLAKTIKYINTPYEVLNEIQSGRISNEGKEVLTTVYPELYNELKGRVMNGLADAMGKGKVIPTHKRLGLSFFLDQPLDSSLKPKSIQANQAAFAMPMPTQNAPSGAQQLSLAGRTMTATQKIASKSP